jgi:hypothetical protein
LNKGKIFKNVCLYTGQAELAHCANRNVPRANTDSIVRWNVTAMGRPDAIQSRDVAIAQKADSGHVANLVGGKMDI